MVVLVSVQTRSLILKVLGFTLEVELCSPFVEGHLCLGLFPFLIQQVKMLFQCFVIQPLVKVLDTVNGHVDLYGCYYLTPIDMANEVSLSKS